MSLRILKCIFILTEISKFSKCINTSSNIITITTTSSNNNSIISSSNNSSL